MEESGKTAAAARTWMLRLGDGREFGPADLDQIEEWARQGRVPHDGLLIDPADPSQVRSVFSEPRLARVLKAPPTTPVAVAEAPAGPAPGLVPYRNPCALAAYYCGIFSLLPFIGVLIGIPAFILGIMGWINYRKKPEIKGGVHAWVGIIMGGLLSMAWIALGFMLASNSGF